MNRCLMSHRSLGKRGTGVHILVDDETWGLSFVFPFLMERKKNPKMRLKLKRLGFWEIDFTLMSIYTIHPSS